MSDDAINQAINNYVRDNLSPTPEHREYISKKYEALSAVLGGSCFQTGSYARFTAINPVHDLDVIYVVKDAAVKGDTQRFMEALAAKIRGFNIPGVKSVGVQSHSVKVLFSDNSDDFSIDVVPALELTERNQYGDPLYEVPEILKLNPHNRTGRYQSAALKPIEWSKSDPRGYIRAASDLNEENPNFRHAAKFGKGWRHACKMAYGDDFKFKSFHFEQMFHEYFVDNPLASTTDAIIACLGAIPAALERPQIADRADSSKFIDEYVRNLTADQKSLIVRLQAEAYALAQKLPGATSVAGVNDLLAKITNVQKTQQTTAPAATVVSRPHQPWAF
jgi:hypothetical protein